jgi:hypothetical protein
MKRILHAMVLTGVLVSPVCFSIQRDKNHSDAFIAEPEGENRLAQ